jgi:hypothetical protein
MDKLTDLPPLALVVFGGTLAVIFAIRYLGLWQGEKALAKASPAAAQVAAVIVDPTALNAATAALEKHTAVMEKMMDAAETIGKNMGHMATELDRIREELRIHREIRRH